MVWVLQIDQTGRMDEVRYDKPHQDTLHHCGQVTFLLYYYKVTKSC